MELPSTLKIKLCENSLKKFESTPDELILPIDSKGITFSGLSEAIQVVMTWARSSNSRSVIVKKSVSDSIDDTLERVIERPHHFVAAMFAKSIHVISAAEKLDARQKVNSLAKAAVENQHISRYGQTRGPLCWSIFVDHSSKGFDPRFYMARNEGKHQPRSKDQIQTIISNMVVQSSSISGGAVSPSPSETEYLGRVFFELFINTHEHGSRDRNRSDWLLPGVRVIYSNGINLTKKSIVELVKSEPALTNYLQSNEDKLRFIEISIIDSGLGYFERWIADHPAENIDSSSLEEEYRVFKKCLTFRQSSSGEPHKGNGLPVVMERLSELNGFMRVRSGRLSLYRDFKYAPFSSANPEDVDFFDWETMKKGNEKITEKIKLAGVAITLLIPLLKKSSVEV
jgi:hypothetical protein